MEVLCTSDLHNDFESLMKIAKLARYFDALVIAGDFTNFASARVAERMLQDVREFTAQVLLVPGNCDLKETSELFSDLGLSLHGRGRVLGEVGFFGLGGSNITPFKTPLEYRENEIRRLLEEGYRDVSSADVKILVSHPPPFETVDRTRSGRHVGSREVRNFLLERKVDLVLCGHIHESRGAARLGGAEIVNTGPAHQGCVKLQVEDGAVSYEFMDF